jgi:hypothetical protein
MVNHRKTGVLSMRNFEQNVTRPGCHAGPHAIHMLGQTQHAMLDKLGRFASEPVHCP